ncbi:MAG: DUF4846 domain-containing protein [Myxococcota bacterium]
MPTHAAKPLPIFIAAALLSASPTASAQTYTEGAYGFLSQNELIARRVADIPVPVGFSRIPLEKGFPLWLRKLPLLPSNAKVVNSIGEPIEPPDAVAAIAAVPVLGNACQCADMAILLYAFYKRFAKEERSITFSSLSGDKMEWLKWRDGTRYALSANGKRIVTLRGKPVGENYSEERTFTDYLKFVFQYANSASLYRDLKKIETSPLIPGDMYIQPPHTPGGLGHLSIILDAAENEKGERIYLIGYGYTPAMSLFIARPEADKGIGDWFTEPGFRNHISRFGDGKWRRW